MKYESQNQTVEPLAETTPIDCAVLHNMPHSIPHMLYAMWFHVFLQEAQYNSGQKGGHSTNFLLDHSIKNNGCVKKFFTKNVKKVSNF